MAPILRLIKKPTVDGNIKKVNILSEFATSRPLIHNYKPLYE